MGGQRQAVRPANGAGSLVCLRGGVMGVAGLCGATTPRLGQVSGTMTNNRRSPRTTSWCTGCEFSVAQKLLALAQVEDNSGIRERCG